MGSATEMCVTQTAIDARERELKVTVLEPACAHLHAEDARVALVYLDRVVGVKIDRESPPQALRR